MTRFQPETLRGLLARVQAAAGSGANAVAHMSAIAQSLRDLAPPDGALQSRPYFERAALFAWTAFYEQLDPGDEQTVTIEAPHDLWCRGIVAGAIPRFDLLDQDAASLIETFGATRRIATNYRGLFDFQFRLDGAQGFQTRGTSAAFVPAATGAGDGTWTSPMDWTLQKNQTIDVTFRNRTPGLFPAGSLVTGIPLRFVSVTFWCQVQSGNTAGLAGGSSLA